MTITVNIPEYDQEVEFPDDATPEQISSILKTDFPSKTDVTNVKDVSTFKETRTPENVKESKPFGVNDPRFYYGLDQSPQVEQKSRMAGEVAEMVVAEEKSQKILKQKLNSSVNWTKSYKEFWENRKESPKPTTAEDVPMMFRPVYTGSEPLDNETLSRLGFNTHPMAQAMGQTVDTLHPEAWNYDDISVNVLGPEEHARKMAEDSEGMFMHGGPQPTLQKKEPGLWSLPIPTKREKVGQKIAENLIPFYNQIKGEVEWRSPETAMVIPTTVASSAMLGTVGAAIIGKIGASTWFRMLTNRERSLVVQSISDMEKAGVSEGKILRTFQDKLSPEYGAYKSKAFASRSVGENVTPESPTVVLGANGRGITKAAVEMPVESKVDATQIIGGRGMSRKTPADLQTVIEQVSKEPAGPLVDTQTIMNEVRASDKNAGRVIFEKHPEDTGGALIHVRRTHERYSDTIPAQTAEGGVGEEQTTKKVYPDVYQDRFYAVTPESYADADFVMAKIDGNLRGVNSEFIVRPPGPILKSSSETSAMIMGRAKSDIVKAGFAPGDVTAAQETFLRIAKDAGYAAVDTEKPIGAKVLKDSPATPITPKLMQALTDLHNTNKGLTVDPFNKGWIKNGVGEEIKSGYGVEMYPKQSLSVNSEKLTPEVFRHFMLTRANLISMPDHYIGTEAIAGKSNIGVSKIFQNIEEAFEAARIAKQERIWDYARGESIDVPYGDKYNAGTEIAETDPTPSTKELKGDMEELGKSVSQQVPQQQSIGPGGAQNTYVKGQEEIIHDLNKAMHSRLDYGRIKKKNVLGTYSPIAENIRLKFRRDVESDVHETAHHIQKFLGRTGTVPPAKGRNAWKVGRSLLQTDRAGYLAELAPIATKGNPSDEGFAEFLSRYVTNDALARQTCPSFYQFFDQKMELLYPEIRNALLQAREDYFTFLNSSPLTKLHSMTARYPDNKSKWSLESIYTAVVDELYPLKKAVEALAGKEGMSLSKDPGVLKQLNQGWDGKVDAFIRYGTLNPVTLEKVGPGLVERLKGVTSKLDEFRDYIILKRGIELLGKHPSGMSPKFMADAIRDLRGSLSPDELMKIEEASELFTDYNNSLLIYAKDFLGEANVVKLMEMYPDYVPFYHLAPGEWMGQGAGTGPGKGGALFSPILKMRGTGSNEFGSPILDPIEATIKKTFAVIKAVEENKVRIAMRAMLKTHDGAGKYWRDVTKERYLAAQVSMEEVLDGLPNGVGKFFKQAMKAMGPESEALLSKYANIFRISNTVKAPDIAVWENGRMSILELNKDIYDVVVGMPPETAGWMTKVLTSAANVLKTGATMTLEFSGANPVRDNFNAFVNSRYGFVPVIDWLKGIMHAIKKDEVYWAFNIGGGSRSLFNSLSRGIKTYEGEVEGLKWFPREFGKDYAEHPVRTGLKIGLTPLKQTYLMLKTLAQYGEIGTRAGEAGLALKKERGKGNKEATLLAGRAGQDVSVNFGQFGSKLKFMNQAIPFFNPAIQAVMKSRQRFMENPLAFTLKAISAITIPAMGLYFAQRNDARYAEVPEYFKQSNLIFLAPFKREDGSWCVHLSNAEYDKMTPKQKAATLTNTVWRFPLAPDLAAVFAYIPIRSMEWMNKKYDPNLISDISSEVVNNLLPPFTAAVVTPIMETWANKVFHTGQQLEPTYMQEVSPEYRSYPYTTELAKKESRFISNIMHGLGVDAGVSPIKIDNFMRSAGGGLGGQTHKYFSEGMGAIGLLPKPRIQVRSSTADIPFISRFAVRFPSASMQSSQDFFDMCAVYDTKIANMQNSLKPGALVSLDDARMEQARGGEQLRNYYAFFNDPHPIVGMSIMDIKTTIQIIRTKAREIFNDTKHFTPSQKSAMINQSYFMINDLAKKGMKIILNEHTDSRPGVPDAEQIGQ